MRVGGGRGDFRRQAMGGGGKLVGNQFGEARSGREKGRIFGRGCCSW